MQTKSQPTEHEISLCGSGARYWVYNADKPHTILMLHGFSGNHRGLAKIIDELEDFRLVVPDLPGFGDSTPMTKYNHTVKGYGHFVEHFIEALKLDKPVLFGHSLGSVVAARVAATAPQLIANQLILVSPISSSPFGRLLSPRHVAARIGEAHYWLGLNAKKAGERLVKSRALSRTTTFLLTKTRDKKLRREIYNHHLNDLTYLRHKDVFYEAYRSLNRDGIINYAPQIKQHVLLIAGAADSVWPRQTQKTVAERLQHVNLVLIPKVGHLTHFEAPKLIGSKITRFLKSDL